MSWHIGALLKLKGNKMKRNYSRVKATSSRHSAQSEKTESQRTSSPEPADFLFGRHPVAAFLKDGDPQTVNKIFLQQHLSHPLVAKIHQFAAENRLVIQEVPKQKLDELTDNQNHQGVLITLAPYHYWSLADLWQHAETLEEELSVLILDGLNDPHNLGSIIRTANAAGFHAVIIPKRRSVGVTGIVAKTAAGALENVPVVRVNNLVQAIKELKEHGLWIFGTAMQGVDYRKWDARGAIGLVIGSEGKGISPLVAQHVDQMVTIPMVGQIQSLNASVAAGLLMYKVFENKHTI